MAISDSRRLNLVLQHLHPSLNPGRLGDATSDYYLVNNGNGAGTQLQWNNGGVSEPTAQQLADAKEPAMDAWWWKILRSRRTKLLVKSDWSQGADVPSSIKTEYATYRQELRDLPTTVSKPSFATLNTQESSTIADNIMALMPTEPS